VLKRKPLALTLSLPPPPLQVERVQPLLQTGHQLLVTLLLCNALVVEALPIFLDRLGLSSVQAVLLSVTAVLIAGEIIPQAICTKYGLQVSFA
jgi:metal transporter CNNM